MRIALLTFNNPVFKNSFSGVADYFIQKGHTVGTFYHPDHERPENKLIHHYPCRWWEFELHSLEQWKPDRILIFNGSFVWCNAATQEIKRRWKTYYAELAWLPQKNQIYIDPEGPGGRSALCRRSLDTHQASVQELKVLKDSLERLYPKTTYVRNLPKNFILVPLQIEADTSILHDSPWFKTNHSLVGFVRSRFPNEKIVVKPHPLGGNYSFQGVTVLDKSVSIRDILPHAKAVIGINSTTLIEALVHYKPVACLGVNVACNKGVFWEGKDAFLNPEGVLKFHPSHERVDRCLHLLKSLQFPASHPPAWLERYLTA